MVQKNVAFAAAAVLAVGFSSVTAAPLSTDDATALYARAGKAVGEGAKKVVKDLAHGALVDAATDKIKSATTPQTKSNLAVDNAIKKQTSPFNQNLVNAVAFNPKKPSPSHKKRDLLEELFERAFNEEELALFARADKIIKAGAQLAKHVVKDAAHSQVVDAATDKVKDATQKNTPISSSASAAINKLTAPKNPALVNAIAFNPKKPSSHKKRELVEELFERDFDEEELALFARADKVAKAVVKVAKDAAHGALVDAANDKIKSVTQKDQPISASASAAISKLTGPKNPAFVNAAINKKPPTKKRDLAELYQRDIADIADFLEARWLELEDLD